MRSDEEKEAESKRSQFLIDIAGGSLSDIKRLKRKYFELKF